MEVDRLDRDVVDGRLCGAQSLHHGDGQALDLCRQRCRREDVEDVREVAGGGGEAGSDDEAQGADAGPRDRRPAESDLGDDSGDGRLDGRTAGSGVDQGRDEHVPGEARRGVDPQRPATGHAANASDRRKAGRAGNIGQPLAVA